MSLNRRLDDLENRTPLDMIKWDGRPETAEAYIKACIAMQDGCGPKSAEKIFADYEGDDPQAYVEQIMAESRV